MPTFATFGAEKGASAYPGVANVDDGTYIEQGFTLPWVRSKEFSWVDYRCTLEVFLDPGTALHKPLPQGAPQQDATYPPLASIDSLGSVDVYDNQMNSQTGGVHTKGVFDFQDIVQRMASSTYRFLLRGWALRAGYQIPIPKLVSVAGVPAIPAEYQHGFNDLVGNYSGIPLWFARWELWYYVVVPPYQDAVPPTNLARHITATEQVPDDIIVPASQPDMHAVKAITDNPPAQLQGFAVQGKTRR